MDEQAMEVPLHELLRQVPKDARLKVTDSFSTHFYPVGLLCHRAAVIIKGVSMNEQAKRIMSQVQPESKDPWRHRSAGMRCSTCMWFVIKATEPDTESSGVGRCRRHAPTIGGYPVVKTMDWCGDHRLDETK